MGLLYAFEQIRMPVMDAFFSAVTILGEMAPMLLISFIFLWCINKKHGYYLFVVGLFGMIFNNLLKMIFRVPRPWVKDPNFTIVESAREAATGYSFPSGHTETAVGLFGGIARFSGSKIIQIICVLLASAVAISRMYLGVHTPADVGVSIVVALIFVFGLYPLVEKGFEKAKNMDILFGAMLLISIAALAFVVFYPFPADTDPENLSHGIDNAYKSLGAVAALWASYHFDRKFVNFDPKAAWWAQILKVAVGMGLVLLIQNGTKAPLLMLFGGNPVASSVRYFLMAFFAGGIWPMVFKYLPRGKRK
jgi:undecaprenyl-diphosphatase